MKTTNKNGLRNKSLGLSLAMLLTFYCQLVAQESEESEDIYQLSPFTISESENNGYLASTTLAGTRIKTDLKDVASAITVITSELLDDTGSTDLGDILIYTPNAEIAGIGGNFSSADPGQNSYSDVSRRNPEEGTRIRGLASADKTRNYIGSSIPFDTYNSRRLVINRGANSILFGLGSPAGIINYNTKTAEFFKSGELEHRYGSYGSNRLALDYQDVLVEDKLAGRVSLLYDDERYRQDFTFERSKRGYAALTYTPFENTIIRLNAEDGTIESNLPALLPPHDFISTWWDPEAHPDKVVKDTFNAAVTEAYNVNGETTVARYFGPPSVLWSPAVYWDDVASPRPHFSPVEGAEGVLNFSRTAINGRNGYYAIPRPSAISMFISRPHLAELFSFFRNAVIQDTGIFNFYEQNAWGPNQDIDTEFDNFHISVEQTFGDWAGIEANYYKEDVFRLEKDLVGTTDRFSLIGVDITDTLHTGDVNTNLGRPLTTFTSGRNWRQFSSNENSRLTGFVRYDAQDRIEGSLGKLLGSHTFTGFLEKNSKSRETLSGPVFVPGDAYLQYTTLDGNPIPGTTDITNGYRQGGGQVYLGNSLIDLDDVSNANIQGIQKRLIIPDSVKYRVWDVNSESFVTADIPVEKNAITSADLQRTKVESRALVWQSKWLDDLLVGTLGWRKDDIDSRADTAPRNSLTGRRDITSSEYGLLNENADSVLSYSGDTLFTWGVVLNAPEFITDNLPLDMDVSLHYGKSENTRLNALRVNFLNESLAPEGGVTEDKGATFSFLNNRLIVRANWYETTQANVSAGLQGALSSSIASDARIISWIPTLIEENIFNQDDIENLRNYPSLDPAIVERFDVQIGAPGTASITVPSGMTIVSDLVSSGSEFEIMGNITEEWSVAINVAQQEAVRDNIDPAFVEYALNRFAEWQPFGDYPNDPASIRSIFELHNETWLAPLNISLGQQGAPLTNEIREWRANLITNYQFSSGSPLKGWNVGGGIRWQDKVGIGFPVIFDADLNINKNDVTSPFFGPEEVNFDAWIGYERGLLDGKVLWNVQLNVRNLADDDDLIPVFANPDGSFPVMRIPSERTFELRNVFKF